MAVRADEAAAMLDDLHGEAAGAHASLQDQIAAAVRERSEAEGRLATIQQAIADAQVGGGHGEGDREWERDMEKGIRSGSGIGRGGVRRRGKACARERLGWVNWMAALPHPHGCLCIFS